MYGHRPKNKGLGMVGKTPKHMEPDEPVRSTYVYDPKNNVNNAIFQTRQHESEQPDAVSA